jgi:hypothetical protein
MDVNHANRRRRPRQHLEKPVGRERRPALQREDVAARRFLLAADKPLLEPALKRTWPGLSRTPNMRRGPPTERPRAACHGIPCRIPPQRCGGDSIILPTRTEEPS